MITLTERAKKYLNSIDRDSSNHVSLSVRGGGCSGFQDVWGMKNDCPEVNWSDPIDDILVIDPLAEMYLLGSEVDYITELGGSYLAVKNPMQTSSCGCGESFGI